MNYHEYRLEEITINFNRKRIPLSARQRAEKPGKYPYFGAQGIVDYIDSYLFDGTYLLLAEDGENLTLRRKDIAQIVSGKFWVNNHAHVIQTNALCDLNYLCYWLNTTDLSGYITGSAQPKLSLTNLGAVKICLPDINEQRKVVSIIEAIDQKIALNIQINDNLPPLYDLNISRKQICGGNKKTA